MRRLVVAGMTDREAIKGLANIVEYWTLNPHEQEYAKTAISALQERIDRGDGCDWCEGGACDVVYGDGFRGEIDNGDLVVWNDFVSGKGRRKINYCPMCGRKLKPAMPGEEV